MCLHIVVLRMTISLKTMISCWIPVSMIAFAFSKRNLIVVIHFEMFGSIFQSTWHQETVPIKAKGRIERATNCFMGNGVW